MSEVNIPAKMKAIQVVEYKKPYEIREVSPPHKQTRLPSFRPFPRLLIPSSQQEENENDKRENDKRENENETKKMEENERK